MRANGITNPNTLAVDQRLIIPGLEGIQGILESEVINFGDSYRSLMRRTQVPRDLFMRLNRVVSPSEFYVGSSMVIPRQEESQALHSRVGANSGESLFEAAVTKGSDVWTLVHFNRLAGSWDGIPGDVLVAPGEGNGIKASGLPPVFEEAEIYPLPLKQGGTGVIRVKTPAGTSLGGLLVDHELQFFPGEDGSSLALQGIHALIEPGTYPLRLDATLPDGSQQSFEQTILVISGNYPEDPLLYVDPVTIDPASTEAEQQQLIALTLPATPIKHWGAEFISPAIAYADSTYFTSRYGNRRTYIGQGTDLKVAGFHTGLDFGGGEGLAISAPAAGQVIFAGPLTVRGNATLIDHGWGVYSGFWHQSQILVQIGQMVEQNEVVGLVGGTGRVTGAHLHWDLWVNGVQVDPLDWLIQNYP
jgi:murein DD-endopeptidase MepM/ murein hydrolase activator NlpD